MSAEVQLALRRLLVVLERPAVLQEWQYRGLRKDMAPEPAEREENNRQAA